MNDISFDGVADAVPVTLRPNPFYMATKTHLMPPGYTIDQMLAMYPEGLPEGFSSFGVVRINGEIIPRHLWKLVKIKRGPYPKAITLHMLPGNGGGGGGGKNALMIIGSIAILAATAWIGAGALVPILGEAFAAGTVGAAAASAAVGIAGTLALSALAPPPLLPKSKSLTSAGLGGSLKYASVQGNVLEPLATIPTVLGLITASPPHLVRPYTKMISGKVHAFGCVGFAGFLDITNVRINGVDSAALDRVTTHVVENGASQTLATENCWEQQPNLSMSKHQIDPTDDTGLILLDQTTPANSCPQYHYFRTAGLPTNVRIRFAWPAGLYQVSSTGNIISGKMTMRIEIRRIGQVSWSLLPVLIFAGRGSVPIRSQVTLRWQSGTNGTLADPVGTGSTQYDAVGRIGIGQTWAENCHADYIVDATNAVKNIVRDGTLGSDQGWLINVLTTTSAHNNTDEFEIRIKRGFLDTSTLISTENWFGSIVDGSGNDSVDGGASANQINAANEVIIESFATVRTGAPLDETDLSYIEVDAEEFAIESISATWQTKAGNWSGAAWGALEATNTNIVASLFRHVLLNSRLNAEPLDSSLLEQASGESLVNWYNDAVAASPDYTCNMVCDGLSVENVLQIIASCGHAAVRRSDKWGVIAEKDRSASPITQMFSPRNTWNNNVKVVFPDPPVDGLFITYLDSTDDYSVNEATVTITGGGNIESIEYPGIVSLTRIQERARLDLRQRKYRNKFYSFNTDMQGIVSQRGDLVGYSYDVLEAVRRTARIRRVLFDGTGQATGVVLDEGITLADFLPSNVGIVMTRLDGTITQKQVNMTGVVATTPETQTLLFTSVIAGLGGVDTDFIGAHVMIGVLNSEYRRCLVFDITWDSDLVARMTLVDEAASLIHPLSS